MREHEPAKSAFANQRARLRAKIIPDKENINGIRRRVENTPADADVVINDMAEQGLHQLRLIGHLEQQVLHAQQINGVVPKRRPIAAQDGKLTMPSQRFSSDLRYVHPLRVGPG